MNGTNCQMIVLYASSVNMFKNLIDRYLIRAGYTDEKIVGLSITQWLPCPLAIWNLFEMAILLNLVKSEWHNIILLLSSQLHYVVLLMYHVVRRYICEKVMLIRSYNTNYKEELRLVKMSGGSMPTYVEDVFQFVMMTSRKNAHVLKEFDQYFRQLNTEKLIWQCTKIMGSHVNISCCTVCFVLTMVA